MLIPDYGIRASFFVAAGVNVAVGATAILLSALVFGSSPAQPAVRSSVHKAAASVPAIAPAVLLP